MPSQWPYYGEERLFHDPTGPHTSQSHRWLQTVSIVLNPPVRAPLLIVPGQVGQTMLDYVVYVLNEYTVGNTLNISNKKDE